MNVLHLAAGLRVCDGCGAPYCRECGRHSVRVDSFIRPGWPEGGYSCSCGWAVGDPVPPLADVLHG